MTFKVFILACAIFLASCDDDFGISSAFLHISTPPKQVAFTGLGEYSGQTISGIGYKKNYYIPKFFTATWVEAKAICKSFDLELATFETSDEAQQFMNKISEFYYFRNNNDSHVFTLVDGITLTPKSPTDWYWTNSGEKIPYNVPWTVGEPNHHNNWEDCLSIGRLQKIDNLGFNDYSCDKHATKFICQKTIMK